MNTQVMHCEVVSELEGGGTVFRITERIKVSDLDNIVDNGYPIAIVVPVRNSSQTSATVFPALKYITMRSDSPDRLGMAKVKVLLGAGGGVNLSELSLESGSLLMSDYPNIEADPDLLYIFLPAQE